MLFLRSEVAYLTTQFEIFRTANRPKTSPNIMFCSMNGSPRDLFIVTLSDRQELSPGRKEAADAHTTCSFLNTAIRNILRINTTTGDDRRLPPAVASAVLSRSTCDTAAGSPNFVLFPSKRTNMIGKYSFYRLGVVASTNMCNNLENQL